MDQKKRKGSWGEKLKSVFGGGTDRNATVIINNSYVVDSEIHFSALTGDTQSFPQNISPDAPSPCDFIDMGQEGNRQHIEAMKQIEDQKK